MNAPLTLIDTEPPCWYCGRLIPRSAGFTLRSSTCDELILLQEKVAWFKRAGLNVYTSFNPTESVDSM